MPAFVDTNVLGYLLDDSPKETIARKIAATTPHISVQVLNEFFAVCKKAKRTQATAYALTNTIAKACVVHDVTFRTYQLAQTLAVTHQISHWDALIVAAAQLARCDVLFSEDLQHNMKFGALTLINPFLAAPPTVARRQRKK
jgi:predicted nucleic acid-binding protein